MKTIKKLLTLALLLSLACTVHAGSNGTTVLPFLEMPAGARYIAMGSAGTAIADDSTAMYWNPGLLGKTYHNYADLMHSMYFEGIFYDYASAAVKLNENNTIGVSLQFFSYGDIDTFDASGYATGSENPMDMAASVGYGINIKGFGIGVAGKFIQSKLINTASTFAFDFGISAPSLIQDKLELGAAIVNVGPGIKYDQVTEDLPMTIRIGSGFYITDNLLVSADFGIPKESDAYYAAGAEYRLEINEEIAASLRAGYNNISDSGGDLAGLSAGAGFDYKSLFLDYAFVPMGDLGDTHRISLTFMW